MTREQAREWRRKIEVAATQQTDETALQSIDLFPKWKVGINVVAGERYQHNGILYRVIQSHTTQADWTPDAVPALFAVVSVEEWPEWIQPTGSHDAYNTDAKVSHNEKHWVSLIDGNVWEPGAAGTENLWAEQ